MPSTCHTDVFNRPRFRTSLVSAKQLMSADHTSKSVTIAFRAYQCSGAYARTRGVQGSRLRSLWVF
jgi:hypothetical protein